MSGNKLATVGVGGWGGGGGESVQCVASRTDHTRCVLVYSL